MRPELKAIAATTLLICTAACAPLTGRLDTSTAAPVTAEAAREAVPAYPVRYSNPPGSPVRTPIITRLPALIGRFVKHMFVRQTSDRSHILGTEAAKAQFEARRESNSITWIGHMTTLIDVDGYRILTDPWWSNYGSPVPGLGPRRYAPPSMRIEDLPPIDVIVVSHSHYDHLDLNAISKLPNKADITAVVPLGIGKYFRRRGYDSVIELAWEQSTRVDELKITALPAIHWSQRRLFRRNDTLWASFAIESPGGLRIFFGGDSDHGPVHADIAADRGDFDVALLSIGGFHNDGVHCEPEDCVAMGAELGANVLIPLHWGTIYLGEGPPQLLAERFAEAAASAEYPDTQAWQLRIGETRQLPDSARTGRTLAQTAAGGR